MLTYCIYLQILAIIFFLDVMTCVMTEPRGELDYEQMERMEWYLKSTIDARYPVQNPRLFKRDSYSVDYYGFMDPTSPRRMTNKYTSEDLENLLRYLARS